MSSTTTMAAVVLLLITLIATTLSAPVDSSGGQPQQRGVVLSNELGWTVVQNLQHDDDQNVVLSPLGLNQALLVLLKGAQGDTAAELRKALDLEEKEEASAVEMEVTELIGQLLDKNNDDQELKILTRLLINKKGASALKETFKRAIKEELIKEVDLEQQAAMATKMSNEWLLKQTGGQLERFFKDSLDAKNSMVLLSAATFRGKPQVEFRQAGKQAFANFVTYNLPLMERQVPFLKAQGEFRMKSMPELKSDLLEIPYKNDVSLVIAQPDSEQSLQFLNENVTHVQLNAAFTDLVSAPAQKTTLLVPKFRVESDLEIKELLEDMTEMKTLFSAAQFEGQYKSSLAEQKLSLANHKAAFELNSDLPANESEAPSGGDEKQFTLNKPFLFAIRDNKSGAMMILGKVNTILDDEVLGLGFI